MWNDKEEKYNNISVWHYESFSDKTSVLGNTKNGNLVHFKYANHLICGV